MVSISSDRHEPDAVAAYATLGGAEQAISHLADLGYDENQMDIAPRDFQVVKDHPLRRRARTGLRAGAALGVGLSGLYEFVSLVGVDALVRSMIPIMVAGTLIGAALGLATAIIVHRRAKSITYGAPEESVRPGRFEVRIDGEAKRARRLLARWWDPSATPPAR